MAGSLIKNPGGTIAPAGGYIAGRADLVERAACRLTAPGIGSAGGATFDLNRLLFQGFFLAPQMVYVAFCQGGAHWTQVAIALEAAVEAFRHLD